MRTDLIKAVRILQLSSRGARWGRSAAYGTSRVGQQGYCWNQALAGHRGELTAWDLVRLKVTEMLAPSVNLLLVELRKPALDLSDVVRQQCTLIKEHCSGVH
jgi:hypothetical protein